MKYIKIVLGFTFFIVSCKKSECDFNGGYEFIIPASISPTLDTFRIGDTIHFLSEFDNMVREKNSGRIFFLDNFNFYPKTSIRRIDTMPAIRSALEDFDVIIDPAYNYNFQWFSSGSYELNGRYNYNGKQYSLDFKLIPNKTGLYSFTHNSRLNFKYGGEQDFPDKCKDEPIREILIYINQGESNNIELLKNSPDTAFHNRILRDPQEKFYEEGAYVFYVVE